VGGRSSTLGADVRGAEIAPEHDLDELRTLVTVSREHPSDSKDRQIFVRLDGGENVALTYGQSVTIEVEPGFHLLRVHNTLMWRRLQFPIEIGEHLEFSVINEIKWWTYGVAGILGAAPMFLKIQRRSVI
jgi:hypothetical protein